MGQVIRRILTRLDYFSSPASFRVQGQAKLASIGFGILSMILCGLFGIILISNLKDLFSGDSSQIKYTTSLQINLQTKEVENIFFGVKLQTNGIFSLEDYYKYFTPSLTYSTRNHIDDTYYQKSIQFKPCNAQQWKLLGENYQQIFIKNDLHNYFCLLQPINIYNKGNISSLLSFSITICKDHQYCKPQQKITQAYDDIVIKLGYFPIYISFLTPYAELSNKDPLKYKVQQKIFAANYYYGTDAYMLINQFKIQSDKSIWPFIQQNQQVNGYDFGQIFYSFNLYIEYPGQVYTLSMYLNKNILIYSQSYTKIDQMLSYVGGLLGILCFILIFLLRTYNQYRYQLFVAQNSFNYDSDGHKIRQSQFHFFKYIKFRLYFWFYLFTSVLLNDKSMKQIFHTLMQARNLLQVSYFFRRIEILQRVVWKTNDRNTLLITALNQFKSIQTIDKKTLTLQYYQQVINLQPAATVQDALNQSIASFKYLEAIKQDLDRKKKYKANSQKNQSIRDLNKQEITFENIQEKQAAINQQLQKYLKLQFYRQVCQKISYYTVIAQQAQNIQLSQQYQQIQKQMTISFINLHNDIKYQLMQRIPLILLHRLRMKAIQLGKQEKQIEGFREQRGMHEKKVI